MPLDQAAVFVFGSNLQGIHGAGAALHAARWCGARRGQGEGVMGAQNTALLPACYAIPTKRTPYEALPIPDVARHVEAFKAYARDCPKLTFQVTRIGCGLAGFTDEQIAPLFDDAPLNCLLPGIWQAKRDPGVARVIVSGSRGIIDPAIVFGKIEAATQRLRSQSGFEIVSGMAAGPRRRHDPQSADGVVQHTPVGILGRTERGNATHDRGRRAGWVAGAGGAS